MVKTIFDLIEEHKDDKRLIVLPSTSEIISGAVKYLSDDLSIKKEVICVAGVPKPFIVFWE